MEDGSSLATSSARMDVAFGPKAHDPLPPPLPAERSRGTSGPKRLTPPGARRSGDAGRRPGEADEVGRQAGLLLGQPPRRRVIAYREVRPVHVVVGDERLDQLPQVAVVQDDDVIENFSADCSDKPLRDPILPRALVAGARWLHEHRPDRRGQPGREDGVAIEDHEARRRLEGKGLAQLLRHPGSSRTGGDGAADHVASAAADDEKHMKDAEHRGGHREEVHRGDAVPVVREEGRPGGVGSRCSRQGAQVPGSEGMPGCCRHLPDSMGSCCNFPTRRVSIPPAVTPDSVSGAVSPNRLWQVLREVRGWNAARVASLWTRVPRPGSQLAEKSADSKAGHRTFEPKGCAFTRRSPNTAGEGIGGMARTVADCRAYLGQSAFTLTFYSVTGLAMTTPPPGTNVAYSSEAATPGGTSAGWTLR